jgi:3-hydroxy acid dehydrogenase / malonic semialdehyde reductase
MKINEAAKKIALVTGASSGFGRSISYRLIASGYRVIAVARRADRLQTLHESIGSDLVPLVLDVTDGLALEAAFKDHPLLQTGVDVLINNAGLALGMEPAWKTQWSDWVTMLNTNVAALAHVTHLLLPKMVERNRGLIINVSSTAALYPYVGANVYGASKAFVSHFSLNLRADLAGTGIRITAIEPGSVAGTEFSNVRFHSDDAKAAAVYENMKNLTGEEVADMIAWVVNLPEHINVNRLEVMPVSQSFAGFTFSRKKTEMEKPVVE